MDISLFIFLSIMMVSFGYVAASSQKMNFWKAALLGLIILPFLDQFNMGKPHLLTMLGAFVIGYLLPHAHLLEDFFESLSDFINAIRYKDAYEDIKLKEAEVEELRRQYQRANQEANQKQREQEQKRREEQSRQHREQRGQQKQRSSNSGSSGHSQSQNSNGNQRRQSYSNRQQSSSSSSETQQQRYLRILGLDPNGSYTYQEIKKAYRRQASKYHPDKHQGKGEAFLKELTEKMKEVNEAYEKLSITS